MEFQCLSWKGEDRATDSEAENPQKAYTISVFGRTAGGESVCTHVEFEPYFFVEVPKSWGFAHVASLKSSLKREMRYLKDELLSATLVERQKFYGFTNGDLFKFVRLQFKTHNAYTKASYIFRKPMNTTYGRLLFQAYECNIDPLLRFCHVQNIKLAGWVRVEQYAEALEQTTYTCLELHAQHWKSVKGIENDTIAPIVQASFDIETYSEDGSFPDPENE